MTYFGKVARLIEGSFPIPIIGQAVLSATNFSISILVIRATDLATFGQYSLIFMMMVLFRNLQDGVLLLPLSSHLAKAGTVSGPVYLGFVHAVFATQLLASLILAAGLISALGALSQFAYFGRFSVDILLFVAGYMSYDYWRNLLIIQQKFTPVLASDTGLGLAVVISLMVGIHFHWLADPGQFCRVIGVISLAASLPLIVAAGAPGYDRRRWMVFMRRHFAFSRWSGLNTVLRFAQISIPYYVAAVILGDGAIGLVRVAESIAGLLRLAIFGTRNALHSRLSQALANDGLSGLIDAARRYFLTLFALLSVGSIGLFFLIPLFLRLFHVPPDSPGFFGLLAIYVVANLALLSEQTLSALSYTLNQPKNITIRLTATALMLAVLFVPALTWAGTIAVPGSLVFLATGGALWQYLLIRPELRRIVKDV